MSGQFAGATRRAHEAATAAGQQTAQRREELAARKQQCPQSTHVAQLQQQVAQAAATEAAAGQHLAACQQRQQQATEARHGLSHDYHPIDLETGQPLEAEEVTRRLHDYVDHMDTIALAAGLSSHTQEIDDVAVRGTDPGLVPGECGTESQHGGRTSPARRAGGRGFVPRPFAGRYVGNAQ